MNLYLLFAGDNYYPQGGMNDYRGSFTTLEEAQAVGAQWQWDWAHVATLKGQALVTISTRQYSREHHANYWA